MVGPAMTSSSFLELLKIGACLSTIKWKQKQELEQFDHHWQHFGQEFLLMTIKLGFLLPKARSWAICLSLYIVPLSK
jgi:hypothetical protein